MKCSDVIKTWVGLWVNLWPRTRVVNCDMQPCPAIGRIVEVYDDGVQLITTWDGVHVIRFDDIVLASIRDDQQACEKQLEEYRFQQAVEREANID